MDKETKKICSETVWERGVWHSHDCTKPVVCTVDGIHYCKIHSPVYREKKDTEREEKYKKSLCPKCQHWFSDSFSRKFYKFCPMCGTKRK